MLSWRIILPGRAATEFGLSDMRAVLRVGRGLVAAPVFLPAWLLILASCASATGGTSVPDGLIREFTISNPRGARPVFVGFSPRLQNRNDEETAAVADAALKVARYGDLSGTVTFAAASAGGFTSVAVEYDIYDDPNQLGVVAQEVELRDILVTAYGTVVRCEHPAALDLHLQPTGLRDATGRPTWLERTPDNSGYLTAVGSAERRRLVGESFAQADYSALAGILSQISLLVDSEMGSRTLAGLGTITRTDNSQVARGTLRGFYILDRWISDDGRTFFSLAVCPLSDMYKERD